jgi:hypothetical protein
MGNQECCFLNINGSFNKRKTLAMYNGHLMLKSKTVKTDWVGIRLNKRYNPVKVLAVIDERKHLGKN